MKKDNFLISCDFDKIVNETYQLSSDNSSLQAIESSLKVIKIFLDRNDCYIVNYANKKIEIPKNWGIFAAMRSGDFKKLLELDKEFYSIFIAYFELSSEIYLGLNDEGFYFLIHEIKEQKKAA